MNPITSPAETSLSVSSSMPRSLAARFASLARCVASLAFVALAFALAPEARANTINVNGLGDTLANDGTCTVREAFINANNDAATWADCAAGSGADTINLPAGTITFTIPNTPSGFAQDEVNLRGDLDITSSLTVNGNAAGTTINANALDRIVDINPDTDFDPMTPTPAIVVHINRVTMTNGYQNQSGALKVAPNSTVTIDDSTISASHAWADDGGGVYIFGGTVTMTNCTISGNRAYLHAAGIRNEGVLSLISCTVTNNDSDFDNLSGGVWNSGGFGASTTLRNTIVAGNGGVDCPNLLGDFISLGYNVIGEFGTIMGSPNITPAVGDQLDVSDAAVQLGPLAMNGGLTPTHSLGAASIAIDKGHASGTTADQRGQTRPCDLASISNAVGGDGSDSGAFEVQGVCGSAPAPPDAVDDNANVLEDSGANNINVLANDTDANNDTLTVISVTQGAHGSVVITGGGTGVSYTPAPNYFGPDSFTYTIDDGNSGTDMATVSVNVSNVNDAPTAIGDAYDTNSNTPLHVNAPGVLSNDSDIDGDSLNAQQVSGPTHVLSFTLHADGSFDYTPAVDFAGADSFTYRASDGAAQSNTVTVNITIHDTVPPVLNTSVGVGSLWPPNHDLVNVGLSVSASDNSGDPVAVQVAVFSDEDDVTSAGGEMSPDAKNIAPTTLRLRAERSGDSDGRVYLIVVTATDSSNNVTRNCLAVVVPKSQSKASESSAAQQAQAAVSYCQTHNGAPPPGYFVVGDGPMVGPKQ
jgi:hypothetical protein